MPEARFLKIIIIALLLLNAGTLGYLWMSGNRPHHPPPREGGGPADEGGRRGAAALLYRELQLTDAQEAAYKKMRNEHHESVTRLRDSMKDTKRHLYSLLHSRVETGASYGEERLWLDSLGAQQRYIEYITFEHFRAVRALCTPRQQQQFDEVIGEALEQMR